MVNVIKADGKIEPFNEEKLKDSIKRAGIPPQIQDQVLNHVKETSADGRWNISMPSAKNLQAGRTGLAVWVNKKGSQTPLQATGGWL